MRILFLILIVLQLKMSYQIDPSYYYKYRCSICTKIKYSSHKRPCIYILELFTHSMSVRVEIIIWRMRLIKLVFFCYL